jgi:hypothetical protein
MLPVLRPNVARMPLPDIALVVMLGWDLTSLENSTSIALPR